MFKKEVIWREILFQAIEKKKNKFTQKELAVKFKFSLSTVFNALKIPRQVGAIEVKGRFFTILSIEKLLSIWGTLRNLKKEIIYKTKVDLPILKIEGEMPKSVIYTAYSAYRLKFNQAPADYDKVYIYTKDLKEIEKRFPFKKGRENLVVLQSDKFLSKYGSIPPLAQIYVDLWNLKDWYAHDFLKDLKKKIYK
ncbi:hypothetical protein KJ841_02295 [Patescibacteria group bacterium]|nr:hypothetical protein [Patescibacteria group bacterium]